MKYEERVINGILHYRRSQSEEFKQLTLVQLTDIIVNTKAHYQEQLHSINNNWIAIQDNLDERLGIKDEQIKQLERQWSELNDQIYKEKIERNNDRQKFFDFVAGFSKVGKTPTIDEIEVFFNLPK